MTQGSPFSQPATATRTPFVHEWFRMIAQRQPSAAAVDSADGVITYESLALRAAALARHLCAAGAARGDVVAIAVERRTDAIAAALGVLEANCGFVALPLEFPDARLALMLAETTPRVAIADASGAARLRDLGQPAPGLTVIEPDPPPLGASPPPADADPDALAYVVFTSGSSGRPKGIAGRLKAIDHFIRWEIETLDLAPGVRVSQLSSPAFDVFLRDVFTPLCAGGTVCVPPGPGVVAEGRLLADWLESQDINLVHTVPSVFRLVLDQIERPSQLAALRYVCLAGEPLLPADVKRAASIFGSRVQLVNLYGPSETTMTKFFHFVTASDGERSSVPIGKPMPGAAALLMDENGRVCEPATVGEIYIRTPFRSLGYFRRPDLTSEVFVPNPFSHDPDDLIYRTGDLARMLADGTFEFVGRRDHQVKVRGVRIELAEIESALRECGAVRDVVVVDYDDGQGGRSLAAYVVLHPGSALADLRERLLARLPEFMVPASWIALEAVPRTANGKLDRRALPPPTAPAAPEAPAARTPVQEIVAGIWAEVLQRPEVKLDENFFQIGGHSLLATRVVARLRRAFKIELPLRALFRAPTVAALSNVIQKATLEQSGVPALEITRADRGRPLPLSYGQHRLWFLQQLDRDTAAYHVGFAHRLSGDLDVPALRGALREIVRRHEVLRTVFPAPEGDPVLDIRAGAALPLPLIDLAALPPEQRSGLARRIAAAEARMPFDLAAGPLIRAALVRLGPSEHVLSVVMNHAVSDGWSTTVFVREFMALYAAIRRGMPSPLPELPVQYADYAAWEREWLSGDRLHGQIQYWRDRLAGMPPLTLPTDAARPPIATYTAGRVEFGIDPGAGRQLKALARREGVTLFMLLLAALQAVLGRWSGQRDVAVGTDVANRDQVELEGLVGFFVNQLVLRTDLSGDPTFCELLARVRDVTFGAYAHQRLPFDRVVEELAPARDVSRHPLFQTVFALRNTSEVELRIEGVELEDLRLDVPAVNYDLTLVMGEERDTITGTLLYAAELFTARTVSQLTAHLSRVLEAVAERPEQRLSELPLAAPGVGASAGAAPDNKAEDATASVCGAIERRVRLTPTAIAAECGDAQLTYAELDRRANQLAHHLIGLGVSSESVVAVRVPRGLELVVSLVAILKAGAAYLPLDPRDPEERARASLRGARAAALIAETPIDPGFPLAHVHLTGSRAAVQGQPITAPTRLESPDALAYMIYTSGSTGAPKGAMIEHRGLWNHLQAKIDDLRLTANEVVAQNASSAFDISIWQLLAPLVSGGMVHVIADETAVDPGLLVADVERAGVTVLEMVPALLEAMLDDLERRGPERPPLASLRVLVSTGEGLPEAICARWLALYPHVDLVNAYGPTECSDDVTHHHANATNGGGGFVSVGSALRGTRLYVLDDDGALVPPGTAGELFVGGPCVGRGYCGAAALTATRFVPDPFEGGGRRMFRTGDLLRWSADGQLEFLGRLDDQVKIRGYRVEIGEVGSLVAAQPGVRQSLVCARTSNGRDKRLVAYVVPRRWSVVPSAGGYFLPDGSPLAEQNRNETRYLYERIFVRQCYFQHDIELAEDACIVDVGANIGLFTSRAAELAPKGRVLAFEPIGAVATKLRANSRVCRAEVTVFDCGLGEREQEATFTYYPGYSIMSGLAQYADAADDLAILKQYLRNETEQGDERAADALAQADDLLAGRLRGEPCPARLRPLSAVLAEQGIDRVDLLKIDVQRAGLDVLRGIAADDWPRIDQIVMEVHDHVAGDRHVGEIEQLLLSRGYGVVVEQEALLRSTNLYNVYARRLDAPARSGRPAAQPLDPPVVVADLRERLSASLPEYMVPGAFVLLPDLPLTVSGKVDRDALPEPPPAVAREYRAPRTDLESALCDVWKDLLNVQQVGVEDDFFELGGHSLLAMRVVSRIRQLLRVDVPVRAIFDARTVDQLARAVVARETQPGQTARIARAIERAKHLTAAEREALRARATN